MDGSSERCAANSSDQHADSNPDQRAGNAPEQQTGRGRSYPLWDPKARNVLSALGVALSTVLSVAASLLVGWVIDELAAGSAVADVVPAIACALVLSLLAAAATMLLTTWLPTSCGIERMMGAAKASIHDILRCPARGFEKQEKGWYVNVLSGSTETYGQMYAQANITIVGSAICVAAVLVVAALVDWTLFVVLVVYVPVSCIVIALPSGGLSRLQEKVLPSQDAFIGEAKYIIENHYSIAAGFTQPVFSERYRSKAETFLHDVSRYKFYETLVNHLPQILSAVLQALLMGAAIIGCMAGRTGAGSVFVAYELAVIVQTPLINLVSAVTYIRANRVHASRLRGLAASAAEPSGFEGRVREQGAAVELGPCALSAEPGAEPLFRVEGRIEVPKGALAVVKGPNGSGKSTLLDWLRGLCDPAQLEGEASVDASVARAAYLARPVPVVAGGLAENMLGAEADPAAAGALGAGALGGRALSGERDLSLGERQRLGLLRAFSSGAGALLLDEPLQNLDGAYRERALALVRAERGRRTVVAVMHSGELDADADLVLEIRDGRLVRTK